MTTQRCGVCMQLWEMAESCRTETDLTEERYMTGVSHIVRRRFGVLSVGFPYQVLKDKEDNRG